MTLKTRVMGLAVAVTVVVATARPAVGISQSDLLAMLPSENVVKLLGRSQLEFVADLIWVKMGSVAANAETVEEYGALLPLANLIADLDPKFKFPYFVGGVLAPAQGRDHVYRNVDEAIALMQRGVEAVPDYLRLYVQKAYAELFLKSAPLAAANTLKAATTVPGAPSHLAGLATRLLAQSGRYDAALEFAEQMAQSNDPVVRADFELRRREVFLERVLAEVDRAADRYRAVEGHPPPSVLALVQHGDLSGVPADPFGGEIILSPDGARSSTYKGRLQAFTPELK